MRLPRPPYGWIVRDEPTRSILFGFDFSPWWPLAALALGGFLLGFPTIKASLVYWAAATACLALTSCLRGFRLEVSRRGFVHWWTWAGIPYWRVAAPLDAQVSLAGEFGGTDDRVVIERVALDECIALGSSATCAALHRAILTAQARWTEAPGSIPI
jgi:hypothetical protein